MATTKAVVKQTPKAPSKVAKKVYIFFNCDEAKSSGSMNIYYNNVVYSNTKKARKDLLTKVESERSAGRVQIEDSAMEYVRNAILEGDPVAAEQNIKFGAIKALEII